MKICSIHIRNFQQFKNTTLDFSNPVDGEPADQVCLIGRNGTGKSTILFYVMDFLKKMTHPNIGIWPNNETQFRFIDCIIKIKCHNETFFFFFSQFLGELNNGNLGLFLNKNFNPTNEVLELWCKADDVISFREFMSSYIQNNIISGSKLSELKTKYFLRVNANDLIVYSPAESNQNLYIQVTDVPQTSLNDALGLFKEYPLVHNVSHETIGDFWKQMIYLLKRRENDRSEFENAEGNQDKTRRVLTQEFNRLNPEILQSLSIHWRKILDRANLHFDIENANNPIQLSDNLEAYIAIQGTNEKIPYNRLSTGIRNFIFRIGHIYTLYFHRVIENGFLLLDEPENSLFPDFLFDLLSTYKEIIVDRRGLSNTQIFFSTHSPIIAAQFEPFERIILEWDHGVVKAFKGEAPAGDDPNDILIKDFKLKHLMGAKGQKMWEEYLQLRKQLRKTEDPREKAKLAKRISQIGNQYNFEE